MLTLPQLILIQMEMAQAESGWLVKLFKAVINLHQRYANDAESQTILKDRQIVM